jgi:hypothetical protein
MDEKTIKERITALEGQRAQMISNVHAIEGAIQDCKHWLEKISTPKTNDNVMKLTKDKKIILRSSKGLLNIRRIK